MFLLSLLEAFKVKLSIVLMPILGIIIVAFSVLVSDVISLNSCALEALFLLFEVKISELLSSCFLVAPIFSGLIDLIPWVTDAIINKVHFRDLLIGGFL